MKAGFIGLGNLGSTIARRLLESGVKLITWNRSVQKAEMHGFPVAQSPKEMLEQVDIVFLCLFDSIAVESVFNMDNGLMCKELSGKIIVDLSTNHVDFVEAFYGHCEEHDATYLESPVLGSVVPASKGELTVLTSGNEEAYGKVKPMLELIGKNLFYMPSPTSATQMKLINNLALGNFMATIAEAVSIADEAGIGKEEAMDILGAGAGNSMVLNAKRTKLLEEDFSPHFSNAAIYKDLHCLQDMAFNMQRPFFTGSITKELYGKMMRDGKGNLDFSSIFEIFAKAK